MASSNRVAIPVRSCDPSTFIFSDPTKQQTGGYMCKITNDAGGPVVLECPLASCPRGIFTRQNCDESQDKPATESVMFTFENAYTELLTEFNHKLMKAIRSKKFIKPNCVLRNAIFKEDEKNPEAMIAFSTLNTIKGKLLTKFIAYERGKDEKAPDAIIPIEKVRLISFEGIPRIKLIGMVFNSSTIDLMCRLDNVFIYKAKKLEFSVHQPLSAQTAEQYRDVEVDLSYLDSIKVKPEQDTPNVNRSEDSDGETGMVNYDVDDQYDIEEDDEREPAPKRAKYGKSKVSKISCFTSKN